MCVFLTKKIYEGLKKQRKQRNISTDNRKKNVFCSRSKINYLEVFTFVYGVKRRLYVKISRKIRWLMGLDLIKGIT